jgi:hypothetical protein
MGPITVSIKLTYSIPSAKKKPSSYYTNATEREPFDSGDDDASGFPFSSYFCIPFQPCLSYAKHPTALVTRGTVILEDRHDYMISGPACV